jgi:RNA polymerase sigma factor (sigma-70 family)
MERTTHDILTELLVLQAQSGKQQAISQLVDLWSPMIDSRARRCTGNDEGASEVTQESWIAIAKSLRSLRDPSRFGAWAMRIVENKSADWIRARAKQRRFEHQLNDSVPDKTEPQRDDQSHLIRSAIGQLDSKLREIVWLFYMDNRTVEQISITLEIPIGTAKTRLMRARTQLRAHIERTT